MEVAVQAQRQLREWAAGRGVKLGWIAAAVPVGISALSRWLNGRGIPAAVYRHRLADISGIEDLREEGNWK